MKHSMIDLLPEYSTLLRGMQITKMDMINTTVDRLLRFYRAGRYGDVPIKTGIPVAFIMASFEREASSDFSRNPAQGDRWDRPSVNVPKNRGPFPSWAAAAMDAYHLNKLDQVGASNWTWPLACFYGELFNGFGYRDYHRMRTPYLWGGTNMQQRGKYTSDGKFDGSKFDQQPGIVPLMMRIAEIEPALTLPGEWPFGEKQGSVAAPIMPPVQSPVHGFDIFGIQRKLNALGFECGKVDGSFGRKTSAALRSFEAEHGLHADGLLDQKTVDVLMDA